MTAVPSSSSLFAVNGDLSGSPPVVYSEKLSFRLTVGHESEVLRDSHPQGHTHRWTVFLKGPNDTDLDQGIIQKVIFQLHDDFPNAKRVVKAPPYEVTETGYAGFTVPIFVYFVGCKQQFLLEYSMDLFMTSTAGNKVTKLVEIKDPKPGLRAKLIDLGAEVQVCSRKKGVSPSSQSKGPVSKFEALFGPTIAVQQQTTKPPKKDKVSSPKTKNANDRAKTKEKREKPIQRTDGLVKEESLMMERSPVIELRLSPSPTPSPPPVKRNSPRQGHANKARKSSAKKKRRERTEEKKRREEPEEKKGSSLSPRPKDPAPSGVTEALLKNRGLNQDLLRDLVAAVGGDQSDVESIYSSRPSLPRSESPIFQTGDSPEPMELVPNKAEQADRKASVEREKKRKKRKKVKREGDKKMELLDVSPKKQKVKNDEVDVTDSLVSSKKELELEPVTDVGVQPCSSEVEVRSKAGDLSRLRMLQERIMSVKEPDVAQRLASVVFEGASFDIRDEKYLEFDLCSLSVTVIEELFKCLEPRDHGKIT